MVVRFSVLQIEKNREANNSKQNENFETDSINKVYFIIHISFNKLLFISYFKSWSVSCTFNFTVSMVKCPTL